MPLFSISLHILRHYQATFIWVFPLYPSRQGGEYLGNFVPNLTHLPASAGKTKEHNRVLYANCTRNSIRGSMTLHQLPPLFSAKSEDRKLYTIASSSGKNSPTFPTCHLFELDEPNVMEINLSELILTSFN
jgi:hypothetical protein